MDYSGRYALNELKSWALTPSPKPLILRGARQVGKTTLVQMFAHKQVPIEVKNQPVGKMRSLKLFCSEKNSKIAINFYFGQPMEEKIGSTRLWRLPIYLAEKIHTLLDNQLL